jgi:hypothetical protein
MKPFILLLLLSAVGTVSYGQKAEFTVYPNGLIYNDATVSRLRTIADSLQQTFDSIPLVRDYDGIRQKITPGDRSANWGGTW